MFKICLQNRIVRREKDYKCFLCHSDSIEYNFEAVQEHLETWRHRKLLRKFDISERNKELNEIFSISETQRKIIVENQIAIANRKDEMYRCYLCSCYLSCLSGVYEHIKSFVHQINFKRKLKNVKTIKNDKLGSQKIMKGHISKPVYFENEYFCQVCKACLSNSALAKCHCMLHLFQTHNVKQNDVIYFDLKDNNDVIISCLLCKITMNSDKSLVEHLNTLSHEAGIEYVTSKKTRKKNVPIEMFDKKILVIPSQFEAFNDYVTVRNVTCKLCSVIIPESNIDQHVDSKEHCKNVLLLNTKIVADSKIKKVEKCSKLNNSKIYMCFVCNKSFIDVYNLLQHYGTILHQWTIACLSSVLNKKLSDGNNRKDNDEIKSEKIANNINQMNLNSGSDLHLWSEKLVSRKPDSSTTSIANEEINDLVQLDLSKEENGKLLLPRNRNPRKPNKNNKSQLSRNLAIFANTYIEMCIEFGDVNIYNTCEETVRLLQLGTQLMFPCNSTWICIPCLSTFTDDEFIIYEHLHDMKHIENICKSEADDQKYINYPDQFSDLELVKAHMQEESNDYVHCYACDNKVPNCNDDIKYHINSNKHVRQSEKWKAESEEIFKILSAILKNSWYYAHLFICEICKSRFKSEFEFVVHLKSEEHLHKLNKLKVNVIDIKFGTCPVCVTCWYGESDVYSKHINNSFHKHFLSNGEFRVPNMSIITGGLLNEPERNVNYLISESNEQMNPEEDRELALLKAIEKTVESRYPKVKAYIFGSRLSHLGFPDSDLDIFLDCENVYNTGSKEQSEKYFKSVQNLLENQKQNWIIEEILLCSKVPIIKLRHIQTNLKCDISFINGLGVEKSKLIKYFNIAFPVCRQLILYLKKWLILCRLSGSDGITTYAISWFVIFYLQIKGILPSVHKLLKINESTIVDGWECGFVEIISVAATDLTFKDLLEGFFLYYADFNYRSNVICPFLGKIIQKNCFANVYQLPEEMKIYKNHLQIDKVEYFRLDSPMCIQDPVDHSQNITKAVTKLQLQYFMQYCAESFATITDNKTFRMYS